MFFKEKIKIKKGSVYAESLASQSYLYRLGYIWINMLAAIGINRKTSLNPLRWGVIDILWIAFYSICSVTAVFTMMIFCWFRAYAMKDVVPVKFGWGGRDGNELSTDYTYRKVWYYDNGKIRVR